MDIKHFFVEKYDEQFFLVFCSFRFFCSIDKFFSLLCLPIVLRAFGFPIGGEDFFFKFMCFCNIRKFINFFQFFLVKVVGKSLFFHDLASSILKFL